MYAPNTHFAPLDLRGTVYSVQFIAHLDGPQVVSVTNGDGTQAGFSQALWLAAVDAALAAYADLA